MSRFASIVSLMVLMSCSSSVDGLIKNKKWRVVKESVTTLDKTGAKPVTTTEDKFKDFDIMDKLYFDNADKLSIVEGGTTTKYSYKITDSVLTFENPKAFHKTGMYGIQVSTKDSLVLTRRESWGDTKYLVLTAVIHLAAVQEK